MNTKSLLLTFGLITFFFSGCKWHGYSHTSNDEDMHGREIQYSQLLEMSEIGQGLTLCRIKDPWRTERTVMQYVLVSEENTLWSDEQAGRITAEYGECHIIRTPQKRITITASCHAWLLSQLGELNKVTIMCDTAYVIAQNVKEWMRSCKSDGSSNVLDAGTSNSPNIEVILSGQSDGLWISPFENTNFGSLSTLPITLIYCADYMENTPLGRAEWMKFYGRLVGQQNRADSLFAAVAKRYMKNADINTSKRQRLMAEIPFGATWYVPGGASTSAILYDDAGFDYIWREDTHAGSLALSQEAVLAKAADAEVWYFKYMDTDRDWTLEDLVRQNRIYSQFEAAKTGNVWGCNTAISDFFDVTPFRPDSLLESMKTDDGAFYVQLRK